MRKTRKGLLSLLVLALLVGAGIMQDAVAEVRVDATLRTPNVSVRIGNTPASYYLSHTRGHRPIRGNRQYAIMKRDRAIARRLARYTGVPARELLQLRRRGYRWIEIGRWLHLPRPVVRAAMRQQSWKRFLRGELRRARHGARPHMHRRVVYYYND